MLKKEIIVEKRKKIVDLLQDFGFGYADANRILRAKDVKINGKATKDNVFVEVGDVVDVYYREEMISKKFEIVFESENVAIVYKKAGIESAGEKGLESALGMIAVHRLDRNTEGLMVFAKNQDSASKLENAFKRNLVRKMYVAEVVGKFVLPDKIYSAYLVKDDQKSEVKIYQKKVAGSVEIKTKIKCLKTGEQSSFLEVELLTGKTHQIRAHLAFLGNAIIGDGKYGKNENNKKFKQKTQKLACFRLKFDRIGIKELDEVQFEKHPEWSIDK